ncbi:MAG TPA: tRNA (adenosine(37)-N6)-dimethylallyltransferase MiaA [Gemmatales bacterium]|nr:tRNA (adenosine(37)-N6)-dimethylallyltransferase MiaA [Gemmatales bacterium]
MPSKIFDQALVLTGPTGSGKSSIAHRMGLEFPIEIISMDSMAVYRGLDIGTAKPTPAEQREVRYHLIDCLEANQSASVAWWLHQAELAVENILSRQHLPLIVGGTPLYLKAILYGLFQNLEIDPAIRLSLEKQSCEVLSSQLQQVDPIAAKRIHKNDHKRLVRALEVYQQTGQTLSSLQVQFNRSQIHRKYPIVCVDIPRNVLYERINHRVGKMMQMGWLDEVYHLPENISKVASQAAGYKELLEYKQRGGKLPEIVDAIKTRTRQLAKRQLTWFRQLPGILWLAPEQAEKELVHQISSIMAVSRSADPPL